MTIRIDHVALIAALIAFSAPSALTAFQGEQQRQSPSRNFTELFQPGPSPGELERLPPTEPIEPFDDMLFESDTAKHKTTGFLDFNYYWDTRQFNTLTINAGANLPHDIQYFQLTNFDSPLDDPGSLSDLSGFYTEIHLRRPIAKDHPWLKPFDTTWMYADGSTAGNVHRLGVRWRFHDTPGLIEYLFDEVLKFQYSLNFHLLESDGSGIQLEHVYRRFFFDKRIYIAGFADHNIDFDGSSSWVAETQIGLRLIDQLHLVAEYRHKSFNAGRFKSGLGVGLQYVVQFN